MRKQAVVPRVGDKSGAKKLSSANTTNSTSTKPQAHSTEGDGDIEVGKNKQQIETLKKELQLIKQQLRDAECALEKAKEKIEEVDEATKRKTAEFEKVKSKCENEEEIKMLLRVKCRDLERQITQINVQHNEETNERSSNDQFGALLNLLLLSYHERQREQERREP